MYTFESLTKSLPWEKGHGKDSIRNMLRLEDKPSTSLGHHNDILKTKRTNEDKPRTSRGQKKDLRRAAPIESAILPKFPIEPMTKKQFDL